MKRFRILYLCVSLSLAISLLCGVVNALEQNELVATVVLANQDAYPGGTMIASVFLKNNSTQILTIQYVGIHFDWMASDQFLGYDLSDDPVGISPYADQYLDPVTIDLPENITVGEHIYFVGVDGLEGSTDQFTWDSQEVIFLVQDPKKQEYNVLETQVSGNITASEEKSYQSSEAQSLLGQAETAYEQAVDYGTQNSWDEAVLKLNSALTYIQQADAEEQNYLAEKSSNEMLLITSGIAAAAIVVILVTLYLIKKRKKAET